MRGAGCEVRGEKVRLKQTFAVGVVIIAALTLQGLAQKGSFTVVEATVSDLRTALKQHRTTSVEIVTQYLARIATYEAKKDVAYVKGAP